MGNTKQNAKYRAYTDEELRGELEKLQLDYFKRRFTSDPKRIQNPGKFKGIRRNIARIKTILQERATETAS